MQLLVQGKVVACQLLDACVSAFEALFALLPLGLRFLHQQLGLGQLLLEECLRSLLFASAERGIAPHVTRSLNPVKLGLLQLVSVRFLHRAKVFSQLGDRLGQVCILLDDRIKLELPLAQTLQFIDEVEF